MSVKKFKPNLQRDAVLLEAMLAGGMDLVMQQAMGMADFKDGPSRVLEYTKWIAHPNQREYREKVAEHMAKAELAKEARNASSEEIVVGGQGPVQENVVDIMKDALTQLQNKLGPNYHMTLFIGEHSPSDGTLRMSRLNYISTAQRPDMYAMIKSWLKKNEALDNKLDQAQAGPETKQ